MPPRIRPDAWTPAGGIELEPAVELAVRATSNVVVVAGPGAGKTELLAQRACYLLQTGICPSPRRILAISFKRDAARNLGDRVAKRCAPELARRFDSLTFDAFAKNLLDRFSRALPEHWRPSEDYSIDFEIKETKARELLDSISTTNSGLSAAGIAGIVPRSFYRDRFVAKLLEELQAPSSASERAAMILWRRFLRLRRPSAVNFEMIDRLAELLLRTNPKILAALRATYSFVFLDEFQDTTSIQYDLIQTAFHGSPAILTAVGDNKQRIMGWANALKGIFGRYQVDFGAQLVRPQRNYRSAPELVRIQQIVAKALDREHQPAIAVDDGSAGAGECRVLFYRNHLAESVHLAGLIEGWIVTDGVKPRDICILTRKTPPNYTTVLKEELGKRSIKARIESELQDLLAESLTTTLLHFFKLGSARRAPDSWAATMEVLQEIGGEESEEVFRACERRLAGFLRQLRTKMKAADKTETAVRALVGDILTFIDEAAYIAQYPQYRQGNFYKEVLKSFVKNFAVSRAGCEWPEAIADFEGADSVPIMTMHKSKGLEYHTIVFVGLEDSALFGFRDDPHEEGCGFFVAFSRAKKRVVFTFSEQRPRRVGGAPEVQDKSKIKVLYDILLKAGVRPETID
jgi:DNA helicase II / ATP-dependent DNA helicase PcrA